MEIIKEYENYLKESFKGLQVKMPLFYNWSIGLRFDLQKEFKSKVDYRDKEYFSEVYKRAITLFEYCFEPSDDVMLIIYSRKWKKGKIKKSNYIFKQINGFASENLHRDLVVDLYEENEDWYRAIYRTDLKNIKYKKLIKDYCNTDFSRLKPCIGEEIFFLNTRKNILFNIYDDRGLDVLMSNKKELNKMYSKYSSWILEYDRELINSQLNK